MSDKHQIYKFSCNWYGACALCSRVLVRDGQKQVMYALEDHVHTEHRLPKLVVARRDATLTLVG